MPTFRRCALRIKRRARKGAAQQRTTGTSAVVAVHVEQRTSVEAVAHAVRVAQRKNVEAVARAVHVAPAVEQKRSVEDVAQRTSVEAVALRSAEAVGPPSAGAVELA